MDYKNKFNAVKFMREQRDKIRKEIANLTPKLIVEYFRDRLPKESMKPCA